MRRLDKRHALDGPAYQLQPDILSSVKLGGSFEWIADLSGAEASGSGRCRVWIGSDKHVASLSVTTTCHTSPMFCYDVELVEFGGA
jgi:hypothetical protein